MCVSSLGLLAISDENHFFHQLQPVYLIFLYCVQENSVVSVHTQNIEKQNVELQNVELQNVELQNVDTTKRRITNRRLCKNAP
jgi:hypothetical protein